MFADQNLFRRFAFGNAAVVQRRIGDFWCAEEALQAVGADEQLTVTLAGPQRILT